MDNMSLCKPERVCSSARTAKSPKLGAGHLNGAAKVDIRGRGGGASASRASFPIQNVDEVVVQVELGRLRSARSSIDIAARPRKSNNTKSSLSGIRPEYLLPAQTASRCGVISSKETSHA